MHETGMKKQIGHQLVEMEMTGHEEMQAPDISQVYTAHLQDKRGKKGYQVNDQQILRDGRYAEHHIDLRFNDLLIIYLALQHYFGGKITKNISFSC